MATDSVQGHCPMGCGHTLFVGIGGHITCSFIDCPKPDAVDTLLAEPADPHHIVRLGAPGEGFTVQHPLRERLLGTMMDCVLHRELEEMDGPPFPPGLYHVVEDGDVFNYIPIVEKETA